MTRALRNARVGYVARQRRIPEIAIGGDIAHSVILGHGSLVGPQTNRGSCELCALAAYARARQDHRGQAGAHAVATVGASLLADGAVIDVYGIDESADLVTVSALRSQGAGGKITRKLDPRGVTVIADDVAGAAWFVAPYALDIVDTPMDVQEVHARERVAGLALRIRIPGGSPGCSTRARCRTRS
jgi:hypothetical protein